MNKLENAKLIPKLLNYQITRNGEVWSRKRNKFLSINVNNRGYRVVSLSGRHNTKFKSLTIHRLVALSYIPNPYDKPFVHHINHNKLDNRVENLEWVFHNENMQKAVEAGRFKLRYKQNVNNL